MSDKKNALAQFTGGGIPALQHRRQAAADGESNIQTYGQMQQESNAGESRFKGRIEVVQSQGSRHGTGRNNQAGLLYIGGSDVNQGKYVESLMFTLIRPFTVLPEGFRKPRGARKHRAHKVADGKYKADYTQANWCESRQGMFPKAEHLGKQIVDIRTDEVFTIGRDKDGNVIDKKVTAFGKELPAVCLECPLSQWLHPDNSPTGRWMPPPCREHTAYAVWVYPHPEGFEPKEGSVITEEDAGMYYIVGNNGGVEEALKGVAAGKSYSHKDGSALLGILHYFQPKGSVMVDVPADEVPEDMRGNARELENGDLRLLFSASQVSPEGWPAELGTDRPLYAVEMFADENANEQDGQASPTMIPNFKLRDDLDPLPAELVAPMCVSWMDFASFDTTQMYLSIGEPANDVQAWVDSNVISITSPDKPTLTGGVVEEEITEADIVDDDFDMPI